MGFDLVTRIHQQKSSTGFIKKVQPNEFSKKVLKYVAMTQDLYYELLTYKI